MHVCGYGFRLAITSCSYSLYFKFILNYIYIPLPEIIKVYDGNGSFRRHIFRLICVSRQSTTEELLTVALREFRITKDIGKLNFIFTIPKCLVKQY